MTTVSLLWVGDLNQDKRMANASKLTDDRYRPKVIELKEGQKDIRIGRMNSTTPPTYLIESSINKRMISRNHAQIERLVNGGFMLYDNSMNGTYVNYSRVSGGVVLKHGDIVCFGHLNGANLKPGETVTPFFSDLKYQVFIGTPKEIAAAAAANDTSSGAVSSKRSKSWAAGNIGSPNRSKKNPPKARQRGDGSEGKSSGDDDSEDDLIDRLEKSKSSTSAATPSISKKGAKSNGSEQRSSKKHTPSQSGKKPSKHHSSKRGKDASPDNVHDDSDGPAPANINFEEDQEECSARTCKKPQGSAIDWIQCDKCSNWFHQICLGLMPGDVDDEDSFFCPPCNKKR